ncbi:MAG: TonB-dependent receptor [Bacteroidales bacterium]|nr:TonB-dependent receptor [Bacteroidales bacterium]
MIKYLLMVGLILVLSGTMAQNGTIRGSVLDGKTGETLVGVTVLVKGTTIGASTDLDGKFSISVSVGSHELQITYISYQTVLLENVRVKLNEVTLIDDILLQESSFELAEVVISAEAIRTTEAVLMTMKKQSVVIMDGISSAKIKLIGDATAVEAAKRVTGVSIEDGKYVYVRGLGDRYSKTMLNHVDIPGLDPDRNSLQMDIFPTNLVDNMMVVKNFTADLPADFTGGIMNIETKDFPEDKIFSVSLSTTYNPDMHLNPDFLTYKGGKTDFLGFDDGTRAIPGQAKESKVPTPYSGHPQDEVINFINNFNPTLGAIREKSFADLSFSLSLGNQISLNSESPKDPKLGYIFALSYKNDYKFYDNVTFSEYQRFFDPDRYEMRYATIQNGQYGERSTLIGAIAGLAFKTKLSKIRFTFMHLQNGESLAGKFLLNNDGEAVGQSGYIAGSDNLEYNERALSNLFLNGNHLIGNSGWEIDWRISPTLSTSSDPDIRKTAFTYRPLDTLFLAGAGGNPSRIWRSLSEINGSGKVDVNKKYTLFDRDARLKFGVNYTYKEREYEILFFDMQFVGSQSWQTSDPTQILIPDHIYPNKPNSIYYQSGNNDPNPNAYESNIRNSAAYIQNEFSPLPRLRTILGVRIENYVQRHTGRDQTFANGDFANGKNLVNDKVLESLDFFPSVNFIFALTEEQNLRVSYTRTIARPSFKELSFAQIIDPLTNRIFNGSLFTYADWDGKLTETRIDNIDFRWEWFLERGQIFSVSAFFKNFDDPIEMVRIPEQQTSTEYQVRNVGDGELIGLEFELRKDLNFISESLANFNFSGNFTWVQSKIDMSDREFNSRTTYKKIGQVVESVRQMAGQAPYVINAGLTYGNFDLGVEAGIFYNIKGPTLAIVGAGLFPDIFDHPFHSLNFSLNKKFIDNHLVLDVKVSNILKSSIESFYHSYKAENEYFSSYNPGISFGLGMSYKF